MTLSRRGVCRLTPPPKSLDRAWFCGSEPWSTLSLTIGGDAGGDLSFSLAVASTLFSTVLEFSLRSLGNTGFVFSSVSFFAADGLVLGGLLVTISATKSVNAVHIFLEINLHLVRTWINIVPGPTFFGSIVSCEL